MSFSMTQASDMADPPYKMLPKMTPVFVEETYANCEKREDLYHYFDGLEPVGSNGIYSKQLDELI